MMRNEMKNHKKYLEVATPRDVSIAMVLQPRGTDAELDRIFTDTFPIKSLKPVSSEDAII